MKIVTWNIGGGFIESDEKGKYDTESIEYFIRELHKVGPDIVCLQEVHISEENNQVKIVANALGLQYTTIYSIADSHLKVGQKLSIAIISRFPIISSKFNMLTNPNLEFILNGKKAFSHDKGFLEATINYKQTAVRILSGYMVPFRKFGKNFLDDDLNHLREEIEEIILCEDKPEIICVDMNFNGKMNELLPNVFAKNFKSLLNNESTTPKGRKYDKIIISKDWVSNDSEIIKGRADHFLCSSDVELI